MQLTDYYYGVDIGGTKIELAVFDANRQQIWQKQVPTPQTDYDDFLAALVNLTHEADELTGQMGRVGMGVPGRIDVHTGQIFTANIPVAQHRYFQRDLEKRLKRPIKLNNDANCFALSEAWHPDFMAVDNLLGVILGTGVGGGWVVRKQLIVGAYAMAAEIGHLSLTVEAQAIIGNEIPLRPCGCGKLACFEGYLSGPGFEWLYQQYYGQRLTSKDIIYQYANEQPEARAHFDRYIRLLAVLLSQIVTMFDPEVVVIGGGLSNVDLLYQQLPAALAACLGTGINGPSIEKARYGATGGARGAALLNWST